VTRQRSSGRIAAVPDNFRASAKKEKWVVHALELRAGTVGEVCESSGEWFFVDLGFSSERPTCGLLVGDGEPQEITFADMRARVSNACRVTGGPLNLLIEAPLSVAFGANGNPAGRKCERRGTDTRYWYVGLACSVLVAATYLLREVHDLPRSREIRLFEGFVSFKPTRSRSSHKDDVLALRDVAWSRVTGRGYLVDPNDLKLNSEDEVFSAFRVAGMDFGVPPVVVVDSSQPGPARSAA